MPVIHLRNGQKVNREVRKRYTENGFKYGYISVDRKIIEVCRDTALVDAHGYTTYEWSEVQVSPSEKESDDILTY